LPVKRVEIPKLTGSMHPVGIPTVLERLIQQAMAQVPGSDGEVVGGQLLNKLALEFPGARIHQEASRNSPPG